MARPSNKPKEETPGMLADIAIELNATPHVDNMSEETPKPVKKQPVEDIVNPLTDEKINVKFIPKGNFDQNHFLHGGADDAAKFVFCVPMQRNGSLVNPLSKNDKAFFEQTLDVNLSVYEKSDRNFWSVSNDRGLGLITLEKGDNIFDMNDPMDYIRLQVLLCNKEDIAASQRELIDNPKPTYKFVVVRKEEEISEKRTKQWYKRMSVHELDKIDSNKMALRYLIKFFDHDEIELETATELMIDRVYDIMERNPQLFYSCVTDRMFKTKVFIQECISHDIIYVDSDAYFITDGNKPMRRPNQEPSLSEACIWINLSDNAQIYSNLRKQLNND